LKTQIAKLKTNPFLCEKYQERPAYRRMVVGDYLVFYKILEDKKQIEIHRILHGSRKISRYIN